jgi:hypothetical protein
MHVGEALAAALACPGPMVVLVVLLVSEPFLVLLVFWRARERASSCTFRVPSPSSARSYPVSCQAFTLKVGKPPLNCSTSAVLGDWDPYPGFKFHHFWLRRLSKHLIRALKASQHRDS